MRCEDFPIGNSEEPGGVVQFNHDTPADYARIRPDVCTALLKFARAPEPATPESAIALDTLAHESFHLRGIATEAVAECYAMQVIPRVARSFGAPRAEGAAPARFYTAFVYPHMPSRYRSPDCRPGGKLDRHQGWPYY